MAVTVRGQSRSSDSSTSLLVRSAAVCAAAGVGLSITDYAGIGKWLAVAGVVLMIVGLHRFGRSGPDEAIHFQLEPLKRKKRKKKPAEPAPANVPQPLPPDSESSDGL